MRKSRAISISSFKTKIFITALFVVSNLCISKVAFSPWGAEDFDILNNILFPISHANIFHLLCNILCLWMLRAPLFLCSGVIISFVCSLIPEPCTSPIALALSVDYGGIMGMSGILFAIIGAKYGYALQGRKMCLRLLPFILITAFIPNVAWFFHIYCLAMGYMWGWAKGSYIATVQAINNHIRQIRFVDGI